MSDSLTPEKAEKIRSILASGNKIGAIKEYQAAAGCSLAEAKGFIEKLQGELGLADPAASGKKGCVGVLVAGLAFFTLGLLGLQAALAQFLLTP